MLKEKLCELRREKGVSLTQLHEDTGYARSYLHQLEKGERIGSPDVFKDLDTYYRTGGCLYVLWEWALDQAKADKYAQFMDLEGKAVKRHEYAISTVPGLLQTEAYARESLRPAGRVDEDWLTEQVAFRMGRQDLLECDDHPDYRVILDHAVLCRAPRDPQVWGDQLARLLTVGQRPHVRIQVLPFAAGLHDLLGGDLTILGLSNGHCVAYLEGSRHGQLVESAEDVEAYKLSFDRLRDLALSPQDSAALIKRIHGGQVNMTLPTTRLDLNAAAWRKASYSNPDGGNCVEVADDFPGVVPVRDSKDPHGLVLVFKDAAWASFISSVKTGRGVGI